MIYVVGILVVVLGLYGWHCESVKKTLSQVEAKAEEQKRLHEIEIKESRKITDEKEASHVSEVARINADYAAERKRLLDRSRSSGVRTLSISATIAGCPDGRADLAKGLDTLEGGILTLLERGDKAIARSKIASDWIREQQKVRPPKSDGRPGSSNTRLSYVSSPFETSETPDTQATSTDDDILQLEEEQLG